MSAVNLPVGTIVDVPVGRGVIRWNGSLNGKPGKFFGIELYEPNGKNDGTFEGQAYFKCRMNYGLFVRPVQIKGTHGMEQQPSAGPSRPTLATRPSFGHQRTPSVGVARSNSIRTASPASSVRSSSPAKPAATPVSRASRLGQASPTKRQPTTILPSRKSFPVRSSPPETATPSRPPTKTLLRNAPSPTQKQTSPPNGTTIPRVSSPLSQSPSQPATPPSPQILHHVMREPSPLVPLPPPPDEQELHELRAKVRVLEAKRADDARYVRELETRLSEAESFVALRPKLQAKLSSLQTDLIASKRELADAQQLAQLAETRLLDGQELLEMAMLDKEVAEERAEMAESELEELKDRLSLAEVELEVYKEEHTDTSIDEESSNAGKDSVAYLHLEKQNERLKEALVRLRDMTQETEMEQRRKISEMEKDVGGIEDLQSQYDSVVIKLSNAEIQIEDLKLQLDDALGVEEMLVQLTERNLMLGEKIEEMRITIEDLEALKELSDELEENHVETEKALHEDLQSKDMQIQEHLRKAEALEEATLDLEGTILQFRELVLQLQTDLDALRLQTQTAQSESATAASQTAAMISLNLKLQSSASKNQARNIDLELKQLEARESRELLGIVQASPYLPQLYLETDSDATSCYLFFQRLAYKTDLINTVVAQAHGLPESLNGSVSETLVGICDLRGRISAVSILCKRFAAILRKCDVETFLNKGRIYPEIAPMEKRIDMQIDLLRRDAFREMECAKREHGYVTAFDLDLDIFAAAVGLTKTSVEAILKDEDVVLDYGSLDQCKSAKNLSRKLTKRTEELVKDSAHLKSHVVPHMQSLSNAVQEPVNFAITLAKQIMPHLSDVRTAKASFQLNYNSRLCEASYYYDCGYGCEDRYFFWEPIGASLSQLVQEGGKLLPLIMEAENVAKASSIAPWVTRRRGKFAQLNDELQGLVRSLKTKDQNIQESGVKIELMQRRMEAVKKQADTIADLEGELAKAHKQERAYEEAMEQLQADSGCPGTRQSGHDRQVLGAQPVETEPIAVEGSLETSHLLEQIEALRGTVRFLRTENSYLKGQDLLREIKTLPPLPEPFARSPTPPLDPSGFSDTDDSDSDRSPSPPTLRSLTTETKLLYRDVIKFSTSPRVVDLSAINALRAENKSGGKERKLEAERLSRRMMGLLDRASAVSGL
ncbi:dynein associated protein-domain-containing protein [Armillaria novae-zelandiae]|uniref:Dynein associated protein-domain-containing protein n=1 Tax=Armillaria novae-zelandiae TaxID=153914 RepID=A0AA39PCS8_9AGAR|nr:dynein associated protein-domain-containing protein [Armillaria novae-zelandiae]